ncbi:hypothetical protein B0H63DRAFT_554827 [Podospora didyma]|uniref:Uncharacterized protein n=1 Tax=Podospora didyma TaxID=330526 RepID=A0AAE0P521_9PEZI|nr:hypothetical protein B0H63DRAFT_554827 [Podospora didyma]
MDHQERPQPANRLDKLPVETALHIWEDVARMQEKVVVLWRCKANADEEAFCFNCASKNIPPGLRDKVYYRICGDEPGSVIVAHPGSSDIDVLINPTTDTLILDDTAFDDLILSYELSDDGLPESDCLPPCLQSLPLLDKIQHIAARWNMVQFEAEMAIALGRIFPGLRTITLLLPTFDGGRTIEDKLLGQQLLNYSSLADVPPTFMVPPMSCFEKEYGYTNKKTPLQMWSIHKYQANRFLRCPAENQSLRQWHARGCRTIGVSYGTFFQNKISVTGKFVMLERASSGKMSG